MSIDTRSIFEQEILYKAINDSEYFGSVVPYIKPKYFSDIGNSIIFREIHKFYSENGTKPNIKDIILLIKDTPKSERTVAADAIKKIINSETHASKELLLSKTEDFIKKAIHTESLILGAEGMGENNDKKLLESFQIAEEAQKVSLDENFGTSIFDIDKAISYYQDDYKGLLTGIVSFDKMIGKGFREKTLHTLLAPPGIGKSATMASFAAQFLKQGRDVVVYTLEMDEAEWLKRIYANILDIDIWLLESIDPIVIREKFNKIKGSIGTLTVKEFPSYTLNSLQILTHLEKYRNKTGIKEPIVFVDYLGLMNSSRLPSGTQSYEYIKSITAELRSVAQRLNITIFTAHQLNRSAVGNLEAGQESVSDSAGISMFSDSMIFLLQTKQMKELGEIMVNFEKNRMTGKTFSFKIGYNYAQMRFEDRFLSPDDNYKTLKLIPTKIDTGLDLGSDPLDDFLNF